MPHFPTQDEVYRVLQRELPTNVYPDGPASAYYSTADMYATAQVAATAYGNLSRVYDNYFPAYTIESINDWFTTVFGSTAVPLPTLAQQQQQILTKLQNKRGITLSDMKAVVISVIGSGILFDIITWNGSNNGQGAWILGESLLGLNTFLAFANPLIATGSGLCSADPATYGLTQAQWLAIRQQAYTYEVRIYGYTLTAGQYTQLDQSLSREEPARSGHVITSGLDPSGYIGT